MRRSSTRQRATALKAPRNRSDDATPMLPIRWVLSRIKKPSTRYGGMTSTLMLVALNTLTNFLPSGTVPNIRCYAGVYRHAVDGLPALELPIRGGVEIY